VDEFVAGLKAESDSLGHETRISLYSFDHRVENLVWDMDVKHLPSMRGLYQVNNGATALIEASVNCPSLKRWACTTGITGGDAAFASSPTPRRPGWGRGR
jgi:hypothetical protein